MVSESSDHLQIAVLTCIDFVIKEVERYTNVTKIIMCSMVALLSLDHVLSLSCLQITGGTCNSSGITKRPITGKELGGIGATIKNVVFRQVKYGRVIINSFQEFSVAAIKFVPLVATLFQKQKDLLCQPDDINQTPSIPATLQIHKFVRSTTVEGGTIIDFYFLSNGKEPCHTQSYSEKKCGHVERKYESLALLRLPCAYYMKKYLEENEAED